ncbi:MAG: aminotransferase class I/II-fold pyridoxal phosphate-dependent enzyme [Chloroflexota bacterium]
MQTVNGKKFSTLAIRAGERRDPTTNAHTTPIYQTATFTFETAEEMTQAIATPLDSFFYSRTANPTTASLEHKLAALEGTEASLVTSSGMAAVAIAVMISAKAGEHILVDEDLFVISREFFTQDCPAMGLEVDFVNVRQPETLAANVKGNTTAVFTESLTNPNCYLADLTALRRFADQHGLKLIVDNTFLSPYLLRPAEYGADLVVHSATKYISGHGDTVAGVIAGSDADMRRARLKLDSFGQCPSPMNSWLLLRGVRTLHLRMKQHSENGLALATFLDSHPKVEWVRYAGLESHCQNDLAKQLLPAGFGGMMAFKVPGGLEEMNRFANALNMCDRGVSLGDLFTLVYPKPKNGNLIRVSTGCEDADDIIADFAQALEQV